MRRIWNFPRPSDHFVALSFRIASYWLLKAALLCRPQLMPVRFAISEYLSRYLKISLTACGKSTNAVDGTTEAWSLWPHLRRTKGVREHRQLHLQPTCRKRICQPIRHPRSFAYDFRMFIFFVCLLNFWHRWFGSKIAWTIKYSLIGFRMLCWWFSKHFRHRF